MGHGRLDSILGSYSIPGIDYLLLIRPKIPAQSSRPPISVKGSSAFFSAAMQLLRGRKYLGVGGGEGVPLLQIELLVG